MNNLKTPKYDELEYEESDTGIDQGSSLGYNNFAE